MKLLILRGPPLTHDRKKAKETAVVGRIHRSSGWKAKKYRHNPNDDATLLKVGVADRDCDRVFVVTLIGKIYVFPPRPELHFKQGSSTSRGTVHLSSGQYKSGYIHKVAKPMATSSPESPKVGKNPAHEVILEIYLA